MFRNSLHLIISLSVLVACGPLDNDVTSGSGSAGAGANNSAPDPGLPVVADINEDATFERNLSDFATDVEDDALTYTITTSPLNGVAVVDPLTGEFTYTPDENFNDEITPELIIYEVADRYKSSLNTIDITVLAVNDAPNADDLLIDDLLEDSTALTIDLAALSSDVDENDEVSLEADLLVEAAHGTVVIDTVNFTAAYTPNPDYFGNDSFEYEISDNIGTTASGLVSLVIINQDDAPVANPAEENTDEDSAGQALDLSLFTEHADPVQMSYSIDTSSLVGGSATIVGSVVTFIPDANFNGDAEFVYTVADEDPTPDTASNSVTFHVAPVNDDPIADNGTLTVDEDSLGDIDLALLMSDIDGDNLTITMVTNPGNGSWTNSGTVYTYSPNNNFYGSDSFAYEISDSAGGLASGLISITINSVNDDPTADNAADSCNEDESVSTNVVALGSDIDLADSLTLDSVGAANNGVVSINGDNAVYTPNADYYGIDSYTYTLADNDGATATATITVTVSPVNDNPVATDGTDSCNEDEASSTNVIALSSDVDTTDVLSISGTTDGNNGSCQIVGDVVVYTPNADYNGVDTYTFTITDGNGGFDTASVTITVIPVNDDPIAGGTSDNCDEDSSATTLLLSTFNTDIDGDVLTLDSVGNATNGSVSQGIDDATFTPDADFNGVATYTYTVTDSYGGFDTGLVTINVAPVNDAPVATNDTFDVMENSQGATLSVLDNDIDIDGDILSVTAVDGTSVTNGTITLNAGLVVFTPNADYFGDAGSFVYTIEDPSGLSHTASAAITITEENAFANSLEYELAGASPQPQGFYSQVLESGSAFVLNIPGSNPLLTNLNGQGDVLFSLSIDAALPNTSYALTHASVSCADDNGVTLAMTFDNGNVQASTCMSFDAVGNLLWSKAVTIVGGTHSVSAVIELDDGGALLAVYSGYLDETVVVVLNSNGNEVDELQYDIGTHIINALVPYTGNFYLALSDSGILIIESDGDARFNYGGTTGSSVNIKSARNTANGILLAGTDESGSSLGAYSSLYDPNLVLNPVVWSNTLSDPAGLLDITHNDVVLDAAGDFIAAGSVTDINNGSITPSLHRLDNLGSALSLSSFVAFVDGSFEGLIPNQTAANVVGAYNDSTDFNFFTMSFDANDTVISSCSTFGSGANVNFVSTADSDVSLGLTRTSASDSSSNIISVNSNSPTITPLPSAIDRASLCL